MFTKEKETLNGIAFENYPRLKTSPVIVIVYIVKMKISILEAIVVFLMSLFAGIVGKIT